MRLVDLDTGVAGKVFRYLRDEHFARLIATGDPGMAKLITTAERSCDLNMKGKWTFAMTHLVVQQLLGTAWHVRSDNGFLHSLLIVPSFGVNLRSLTIEPSILHCWLPTTIDLRKLDKLESFTYLADPDGSTIALPGSVKDISICAWSSVPIVDLHALKSLTSLNINFFGSILDKSRAAAIDFISNVQLPPSLKSLVVETANGDITKHLGKLPSSLTKLGLGGDVQDVVAFNVPVQCQSLSSFKLRFARVSVDPHVLAHCPASLTKIRLGDIVMPIPPITLVDCLGALPAHVTNFSFRAIRDVTDLDELTRALKVLLPRLAFSDLERAIEWILREFTHPPLLDVVLTCLGKFGLDAGYMHLLRSATRELFYGMGNYALRSMPRSHVRQFIESRRRLFEQITIVAGKDDLDGWASDAFEYGGATRLRITYFDEKFTDWQPLLTEATRQRVEKLTLLLEHKEEWKLRKILSSPLPRLVKIVGERTLTHMSINAIAEVLYKNRENLPSLQYVECYPTDNLTDDSIRLLARMNLFQDKHNGHLRYYVEPPKHVKDKYPALDTPYRRRR